jgi:hypothetical protein
VVIDAPITEIPMFVPAGTILVLLPPGIQTILDADDAGSDRELWLWPGGRSALDEVGGLAYDWDATDLAAAVTSATWNGADVPVQSDATGPYVDVTGGGTLVVNGGAATLLAPGGAGRALRIRFLAASSAARPR